jgi:hypothetical protein
MEDFLEFSFESWQKRSYSQQIGRLIASLRASAVSVRSTL